MGHLIYSYLLHAVLHLVLNVFVSLLLLNVRVVLVLSLHLVGVIDSHKAYNLILIAFKFLLHGSTVVLVRIICGIDLLFNVTNALCLLRGIFFLLNHFKLNCGWLLSHD